ncbi:MAG: NPCBM/NEW2 domain-containing protein [Akkermansiaceae bacterium]
MLKRSLILSSLILSTAQALPPELKQTRFSGPDITPSPACLCAHPNGDLFVGVDMLGSLGKGPGKGKIVRLRDTDHDGTADEHVVFANIDNPRGLIAVGDKLYVLHTVIPADTGIMTGMHLSVLTDKDGDGKADGKPKRLIKNISTLLHNQKRGADHTTNGIRMGIDGWIYIAVGDFGMVDAEDAEGTKITILGGGILRVRPDGTEMEIYTHGLRNIYDIAIDPFMNIFTRGNTNDGGGWNVRFIDQIQSGQYGYPILFKHFTDEIIPALVDVGGGSGTGALYFQEPGWPEKYNNVPMMCDWGRNQLIIHRVKPDGPSFTQEAEEFIKCSQISDVDVDGSGRLYLAAWAGAGYKGNPKKGYVERVVPKNWKYKPFPHLTRLTTERIVKGLKSPSSTARLHAQQEILSRRDTLVSPNLLAVINDPATSLEGRVAAIFTYAQLLGKEANEGLLAASADTKIREYCLRALADRKSIAKDLPIAPFTAALKSSDPRTQVAAAVALGRIGNLDAAASLLAVAKPPQGKNVQTSKKPLYASKTITGKDKVDIDVDINRIKTLYLIIDDAGNGTGNDHGAWCEPMLVHTDGSKKPLTEFKFKTIQKGWGKVQKNKACNGKPLVRADGKKVSQGLGAHSVSVILVKVPFEYVRFQATGSLSDTAGKGGSVKFMLSATAPPKDGSKIGPHATPNSPIVLPHVAVRSLIDLNAIDACLGAIDGDSKDGALWALRWIHDAKVVDGLIAKLSSTSDEKLQIKILTALARLYTKEKAYDGSWWWGTRPDTRGPYYVPIKWKESAKIESTFRSAYSNAKSEGKNLLADIATKHRMNLQGIGKVEVVDKAAAAKKGELGRTSIEDVMLSLEKLKGNKERGKKILAGMACVACHNVKPGDAIKGPDLLNMKLTKEQIAEAIIKPEATISDTWVTVTMKDGSLYPGTLISKDDKQVVVHNIAGIATKVKTADVKDIKKQTSTLMGPHLADDLSLQQFADLIEYLYKKK